MHIYNDTGFYWLYPHLSILGVQLQTRVVPTRFYYFKTHKLENQPDVYLNQGSNLAHANLLNELRREKTGFCICENKDADQLCGNREADQRLCFLYTDSRIPRLPKSEISSL